MSEKVVVHKRVQEKRPEISVEDVTHAWQNAIAMTSRTCTPPDIYAAAGADTHGRLLEMLGVELDDGSILVYHAMKLTRKMSKELELS